MKKSFLMHKIKSVKYNTYAPYVFFELDNGATIFKDDDEDYWFDYNLPGVEFSPIVDSNEDLIGFISDYSHQVGGITLAKK